jgi:spermidine synthase
MAAFAPQHSIVVALTLVSICLACTVTASSSSTTPTAPPTPLTHNMSDFPPPQDYSHLIIDNWFHERGPLWPGQSFSLQIEKILYHQKSLFQDVLVFDSTNHGKVLVLDGVIQCTEHDEHSYQEMMAHIPLYSHPNPKKVLVIGGGDGGVLREIARHPGVEEICICELDKDVIDVSKKYLPFMAKGFDDPRVKVHIMDGAKFMEENQSAFDVIVTDSSDPVGPASVLFETPFYKALHGSLREGGIICTQGECVWLHVDLIQPLIKAIQPLFTTVEYAYCTIPSYPSGQIGFIIATKGGKGCRNPVRAPEESVQKELKYYTPDIHSAAFVLPAFAQRAIFGGLSK